jgi:hypothetical protein
MFDSFKRLAAIAVMACAPGMLHANVITTTSVLNAGHVGYFAFDVTNSGTFDLSLNSDDFDTELFLFGGTLSNLLESDDDSGFWLNSFIDRTLNVGHYIAAIGAYDLTNAEAASGINSGNGSTAHGDYSLRIESRNGTARATAVSEPGTIGMFGAGLMALALIRRRKATAQ